MSENKCKISDGNLSIVVLGEPVSKANSRRLVKHGNRLAFIKSQKALDYEIYALIQLKRVTNDTNFKMFTRPVSVTATLYYASERPDLDESLLLDILQKAKIYKNDRLVREKHIYHQIDKSNPRAMINVTTI